MTIKYTVIYFIWNRQDPIPNWFGKFEVALPKKKKNKKEKKDLIK
jgi:hypothetical protein